MLYGAPPQPARILQSFLPVLGAENLVVDRAAAFARAGAIQSVLESEK